MKAVILAAGKSTRTEPLTLTRPKPLVKVAGKELIKHTIDMLRGIVDEVILVVGYKKEMFTDVLGNSYKGIKLTYVEQKEQLGTGHAVTCVKDYISEDFFLMGGDDLFSRDDFLRLKDEDLAVLGQQVEDPSRFGVFVVNSHGNLQKIVEKPKTFVSDIANIACYKLTPEIFNYLENVKRSERGEYEFTDAISDICKEKKVKVFMTESWMAVTYAWNLLDVNESLIKDIKREIIGIVEDHCNIQGNIIVGEGTVIKSGTYIEGPVIIGKNCKIGPNAYIRPNTVIGDNCHIGSSELKNSIVGDNSNVPHLNYVGDSVIGENCNLGAGTIVANLRHDKTNVKSVVKGELIDTGRRKLGFIMADGVKTGINTSIYPGRKFWPNTSTRPGTIVDKDIME